jgi:hypothetical protein
MNNRKLRIIGNLLDCFKLIFERGKEGVALNGALDEREVKIRAERKSLLVYLCPSTNKYIAGELLGLELAERVEN